MPKQVNAENQAMELHTDSLEDEDVDTMPQPKKAPLQKRQTRRKKAVPQVKETLEKESAEHEYVVSAIRRAGARVKSSDFVKDSAEAAEVRAAQMKDHWERLTQLHATIISNADAERKKQLYTLLAEMEEIYLFTMGEFAAKMKQRKSENSATQPVVQMQVPFRESEVRNTWGEFDGTIKKWPGFRDRFVAAVHNNANISPAYKFQHLSQSMIGKAARTLGEWQLTADNYQLAWERLLQLYDNKNVICRELLRSFFKLPILTGPPRANDLQRMSNVTHETMRQLKAQGVTVEQWDVIVVHMLQERLDAETGRQWELQRPNDFATIAEMLSFLDHQAAALATATGAGRERGERPPRQVNSVVVRPASRSIDRNERGMRKMPCAYCGDAHHPIWECTEYQSITLFARKEFAQRKNLCVNCLKAGHSVANCYQGPCRLCKTIRHNSLLCAAGDWARPNPETRKKRDVDGS